MGTAGSMIAFGDEAFSLPDLDVVRPKLLTTRPPAAAPVVAAVPTGSQATHERQAATNEAAAFFQAWCKARRVSLRDLAAVLNVSLAVAAKKHSTGNVTLTDIGKIPERHRDEFAYEWLRHCRERRCCG